jgi:oxygen-independent coproporphyrinogen-3 oxidase
VYCDFSIAVRPRVPTREYLRALEQELLARHVGSEFDLATLYFGGGTPSKLGGNGISRLMEIVRCRAGLRENAEITLEANPEDVSADAVRAWQRAGVNRLSLGVQSFDDDVLRWMHRTHDARTARRAIDIARDQGLANISLDLIFALPTSLHRAWREDLDAALSLNVPHLSVYGLTVEERTPLGRWVARNDIVEAAEDTFENEFLWAHCVLTSAGFEHYEVSNYGMPGHHSRHNWAYWTRKPYGGIGPSAHEFDGGERRWNTSAYADWSERSARGEDMTAGREELRTEQCVAEEVYLSLRTTAGLRIFPEERGHIEPWVAAGWAEVGQDFVLRLTAAGWLRLDSLANALTLFRSRY